MIGSLVLIFVLVALRFRAAVVPVKLFLTIVVPILFMYGVADRCFPERALDRLGWANAQHRADGSISCHLTSTTFLLVGLALDCDIFHSHGCLSFERVGRGSSDEDAVVQAVEATGSTISAAGLIMALAAQRDAL